MNEDIKDIILQNTRSYEEGLFEDLQDPEEAQAYLEAAFEAYQEDSDIATLLLVLQDVVQAQGGVRKLTYKKDINYDILADERTPQLVSNILGVLSDLGFRIRLEYQDNAPKSDVNLVARRQSSGR